MPDSPIGATGYTAYFERSPKKLVLDGYRHWARGAVLRSTEPGTRAQILYRDRLGDEGGEQAIIALAGFVKTLGQCAICPLRVSLADSRWTDRDVDRVALSSMDPAEAQRMKGMPADIAAGRLLREAALLLRPFWPLVLFATVIGIAGGLATAWLLATINAGLHSGTGFDWTLLVRFALLCALSVTGTAVAGVANSVVGQKIIAALRKDISARILRAPIARIEMHRSYRLMSVLSGDVDTVSAFTFNFSGYAIALAVTIGSFTYLFVLSPPVFLMAAVSLTLGVVVNIISRRIWIRDYQGVRIAQDELHKQYRAITEGAKELKISRPRRGRIHGILLSGAADHIAALKSRAMGWHWVADAARSAIFFVTIGLLLAAQGRLGIDGTVISGAVIVLLYVKGPVEQMAGALPVFDQARI